MARQIVSTPKAARPPATYSQAVKAAGLVFVSGTAPVDPATGAIVADTIKGQTRQCLVNIQAIVPFAAAGCGGDDDDSGGGDTSAAAPATSETAATAHTTARRPRLRSLLPIAPIDTRSHGVTASIAR